MITNNIISYYSKSLNSDRIEVWTKYLFKDVWVFSGLGANVDKGYVGANNINVRIPMEYVKDKNIFKIGDIIAIGNGPEIEKQADLRGREFYNVTTININDFGNNPHIHLGGN